MSKVKCTGKSDCPMCEVVYPIRWQKMDDPLFKERWHGFTYQKPSVLRFIITVDKFCSYELFDVEDGQMVYACCDYRKSTSLDLTKKIAASRIEHVEDEYPKSKRVRSDPVNRSKKGARKKGRHGRLFIKG